MPYVAVLAPVDGKYEGEPVWLRVSIAEGATREDDLLFLTHVGSVFYGKPPSLAYRRSRREDNTMSSGMADAPGTASGTMPGRTMPPEIGKGVEQAEDALQRPVEEFGRRLQELQEMRLRQSAREASDRHDRLLQELGERRQQSDKAESGITLLELRHESTGGEKPCEGTRAAETAMPELRILEAQLREVVARLNALQTESDVLRAQIELMKKQR